MIVRLNKLLADIADDNLNVVERYERLIDLNLAILAPNKIYVDKKNNIKITISTKLRHSIHFHLTMSLFRHETVNMKRNSAELSYALGMLMSAAASLGEDKTFMSGRQIQERLDKLSKYRREYGTMIDIALRAPLKNHRNGRKRGITAINEIASDHGSTLGIKIKKKTLENIGAKYRMIGIFWQEIQSETDQRLIGADTFWGNGRNGAISYLRDIESVRKDIGRILSKIAVYNSKFPGVIPLTEVPGVDPSPFTPKPLPDKIRISAESF